MRDTRPLLLHTDFPPIERAGLDTLQVNLGYKCNLSCAHCHVNAGPTRTEMMDDDTIDLVLEVLRARAVQCLDLTGGAPELHPRFRDLVVAARAQGVHVMDRCNLTVLFEPGQEGPGQEGSGQEGSGQEGSGQEGPGQEGPGQEGLAEFLAQHQVEVVASLPCYLEENVEQQRGKGVYDDSIRALRALNALGYGRDPSLPLNLVYNPVGPVLPPPQENLQQDYKRELQERFGVQFNQLFTLTNMPISRFGAVLLSQGQFTEYMELLRDNYSQANLDGVMCRSMLSVDWRGYLYDCDFNQMLGIPVLASERRHLRDLLHEGELGGAPIAIGEHCFGCTAGQGSSCGGALDG